ncbi:MULTISPECIES: hypothetical protein [Xanthomonas]|uniref:Uncharacterized protein n=2 Tax=Xanthomonas TaxID=338 RepID=A0A7Z7J356_XANCH|nr:MULTISPECIES: hypothetical protein [Xanthomonas]ATS38430.1 hypothetical protein XcfCFBP6988P_10090 [Xanthomonas citri pv. phaseoli var. fuscans]ATS42770.1 hypothetical protein XcfCFBP6989P_10395 [Xanthomonas citri pv. phaseoli var. fuscans]ATS46430.1 hypothetical protein XcfCFBP6990P_06960 [Xanthomonas citri pv. phaseoli var. fuscans]ATS83312.1 hypothetical protein XcfCFBP6991P_04505 [Xanthomonas citri pv. phaseoli var. fuscans]QWN20089.1 hypothetical protein DGM98_07960 [Xanthomonas citri]
MKLNGVWAMYGLAALVAIGVLLAFKGADFLKMHEAKVAAAEHLLDPDSAKFRKVRLQGMNVCGEINGKNAYGAYVGYKRFYYSKPLAVIDPGEDENAMSQILWSDYGRRCSDV